jgi:hypothetical protein
VGKEFCTALNCLINGEKSKRKAKQTAKATNLGRKRQCSGKPPSDQAWIVYDSRPAILDEPVMDEGVLEGPSEDIVKDRVVKDRVVKDRVVKDRVVKDRVSYACPEEGCTKVFFTAQQRSSHKYKLHTDLGREKQ